MKLGNNALKLTLLLALITVSIAWGTAKAGAIRTLEPIAQFGVVSITRSQTARLNVFRDDPFFHNEPVLRIELLFVDEDGNTLSQKVLDLDTGKSAFLELRGSDIPLRDSNRAPIRATVRFVGTPDTRLYMWSPTLEVFDNESGQTNFLAPIVQKVQIVRQ
jgi:hypothetical protein